MSLNKTIFLTLILYFKVQETNLITQIREGNQKAFEMVFNDFYTPLVNYSNTIVKNQNDAEDIVQQLFITVWQKRSDLEKVDSLRNYLYRSVYNASLNRVKQQAVRTNYAKEQMRVVSDKYETNIVHKELQQKINEAIEKLPEQCAKVFKLSRFNEMKYQEIADELNISVKTVENHMGKALKLMRELLKDYLPVILILLYQLG